MTSRPGHICENVDVVGDINDNTIKLLVVNPAHAYHVIREIPNWGNIEFMIDTGAAVSLLHEDIWEKWAGSKPTLTAWTGCPIEIKGIATLTFLIAEQRAQGNFLITNWLNNEAILGLDFLEQNQCIINTEQHTVHLRGKQ